MAGRRKDRQPRRVPAAATASFDNPSSARIQKQQTIQLTSTGVDQFAHTRQKQAAWSVGLPSVATVDQTGLVAEVSKGDARVSATINSTTSNPAATISVLGVTTVTASPPSASTRIGQTVTLTATAYDQFGNVMSGKTATWTSSNTGIATVSSSGVVTGVAVGQATISAMIDGVTWSVRWARTNLTSQLGTSASQSMYVCRINGPGSFTMYVTVPSADGKTRTASRTVFNGF